MSVYVIPPTLGKPVTFRSFSWLEMAERAWGAEFRQPDHGIYQFSDGRKFDSTDMYRTGIYNGGINAIPDNPWREISLWGGQTIDQGTIA